MARQYFGGDDPIGERLMIPRVVPGQKAFGPDLSWEIVGVIADERLTDFSERREYPAIYVTTEQGPPPYFGQGLVVRTAVDPARLQESVRGAVLEVNMDQAVRDLRPLAALKAESMASERLRSLVLTIFAGIAVALAAVGIYGVVSHVTAQRTREIGIRAVLGATRGELMALVLRSGVLMTGLGLFAGLLASIVVSRFLSTLLFDVAPHDPLTLIVSTLVLAAVATVACYVPARRAATIDPLRTLRSE
jgi:putative ABC transport system permease protein